MSTTPGYSFPPAGWSFPEGWRPLNISSCRSCRAQILWCETPTGKRAPVDPSGESHFATCPQAKDWRR